MPRISSNLVRVRIHERIRKRLTGSEARPRLAVFRSNKHIYAQIIDDSKGATVTAASSLDADTRKDVKNGGNIAAAKAVGKLVALLIMLNPLSVLPELRRRHRHHPAGRREQRLCPSSPRRYGL